MSALERILVVNDDVDDILALQRRLPPGVVVQSASQYQSRWLQEIAADVIIIDNDANRMQEAKGVESLERLREHSDAPVIYSSFQPGQVDPRVAAMPGVEVVRSDLVPAVLADRYGIVLLPEEQRDAGDPRLSLLVSYNEIEGWSPGVHCDGRLVILSKDRGFGREAAPEMVRGYMREIFGDFEFGRDREMIRSIFVYDGVNGGRAPGELASALAHDARMRVHVLACGCDRSRKEALARNSHIDLHQVECGGSWSMGRVADALVGIVRAGEPRGELQMSPDEIRAASRRYD